MSNGLQVDERTKQAMLDQAQSQLASVFQNMNYDVSLFLFTSPGQNDLLSRRCGRGGTNRSLPQQDRVLGRP